MSPVAFEIAEVSGPDDLAAVRGLFREYQAWIGVDLGFQGFEAELAALPGRYRRPGGRLLLARVDGRPAGCAALQPSAPGRGELKRLFVRPGARGLGLGRALAERILLEARADGYREVVLDTLDTMTEALALYRALGFREVPPYRPNPLPGARYLGLDLRP